MRAPSRSRAATGAAVAVGLVLLPALVGATGAAEAASGTPAGVRHRASAPCVTPVPARGSSRAVRLHLDNDRFGPATQRAVDAGLGETTHAKVGQSLAHGPFKGTRAKKALPAAVAIPVFVHVIQGRHAGEHSVDRQQVRAQVDVLNGGFHGGESPDAARTRYSFVLKRITFSTDEAWYHAAPLSRADLAEKRALHAGGKDTLNLYVAAIHSADDEILGFSRFPWDQAGSPEQDGVTINKVGLPGGSAVDYDQGDSAVHEVGHWLGLVHTFQGGCNGGDGVADTPPEAGPSYTCDDTADTCSAPGLDPVRNFMDYSPDACMDQFTAGQAARMDAAYQRWRQR